MGARFKKRPVCKHVRTRRVNAPPYAAHLQSVSRKSVIPGTGCVIPSPSSEYFLSSLPLEMSPDWKFDFQLHGLPSSVSICPALDSYLIHLSPRVPPPLSEGAR